MAFENILINRLGLQLNLLLVMKNMEDLLNQNFNYNFIHNK